MLGENNLLFPIGQTFLRLKHRSNSRFEPDDMDFPAPRDDQRFTQVSSRLEVDYVYSERMRDHEYGGSDELAH